MFSAVINPYPTTTSLLRSPPHPAPSGADANIPNGEGEQPKTLFFTPATLFNGQVPPRYVPANSRQNKNFFSSLLFRSCTKKIRFD